MKGLIPKHEKRGVDRVYFFFIALLFVSLPMSFANAEEEAVPASVQNDLHGQADDSIKITTLNPDEHISSTTVFGRKGGYIHPFMSVKLESSDNINFTHDHEKHDWTVIYSPGIWLASPAKKRIYFDLDTATISPNGLYHQVTIPESFTRYQAYLLYLADLEDFHNYNERDTVKQTVDSYFQYNLRGGLSTSLYYKFLDTEDPLAYDYRTGRPTTDVEKYVSSLLGVVLEHRIGEKFRVKGEYNNYYLHYDEDFSEGKNRMDNSGSAYLYYDYTPKTAFFGQYQYTDVHYYNYKIQDSSQHYGYLGIDWKAREKVRLQGKVGFIYRDSDNPDGHTITDPTFELTYDHKLTEKSKVKLFTAYKINESSISTAAYSKDSLVRLNLYHAFTAKIEGSMFFDYTHSKFHGIHRTDDYIRVGPRLHYIVKKWLKTDLGYTYYKNMSDYDLDEFDANIFFLRASIGF